MRTSGLDLHIDGLYQHIWRLPTRVGRRAAEEAFTVQKARLLVFGVKVTTA